MNKKLFITIILILMLSLTQIVLANDTTKIDAEKFENELLEISIDDAVKIALENSSELIKTKIELAEAVDLIRDRSKIKDSSKKALGSDFYDGGDYLSQMLSKNGYGLKDAQIKKMILEKGKDQILKKLEIKSKSAYYNVLLAQKTVELNEKVLAKAKENLKVLEIKFDKGSVTKLDLLQGQIAVNQAQTELDNAGDSLSLEILSFNNTLGLPFDQQIVLADEIEYLEGDEIDLEKSIEKAKENRLEIITAKENLELTQIKHDTYTSYYTTGTSRYRNAVKELTYAKNNIEQVYKNVELDVRQKYLELIKAERALKNKDNTIELSKETVRIKSLFYDYGKVTALDVLETETSLAQAEISRYQLLVSYNVARMMFDNACELGMTN